MKYIAEIMNEVREAPTEQEKIKILIKERTSSMVVLFEYLYDDSYSAVNVPAYTVSDDPIGYSMTTLNRQINNIRYFFQKDTETNTKEKQKRLKNLLECLNWMESATLESVLKKQKDNFPVNLDLLKKSYPDIFK